MDLSIVNPHPRDKNITFVEEGHIYTIAGVKDAPCSVTTAIHSLFPPFDPDAIVAKMMSSPKWPKSKYYGQTAEAIKEGWSSSGKEASEAGTIMHKDIENFFNGEPIVNPNDKEFLMFLDFWNDMKKKYPTLRPYRTEWLVYDESIGLAGSIDCILTDDNGNLLILDWKRSKEIKMENRFGKGYPPFDNFDNCNFSHYSLQLNSYRHMLETKYDKNVIYMMLVILHPNQESYICHPVSKIELSHLWPTFTKFHTHK